MERFKHPRIYHCSFSEKLTTDDKRIDEVELFEGKDIVATGKLDGQNTSIYSDYLHARSISGTTHESMNWIKSYASTFQYKIHENWRICGEDVYATHSIRYNNLESYFYVHSIFDAYNVCLSYDDTCIVAKELGLQMVPLLYRGKFDLKKLKSLYKPTLNGDPLEGFVIRNAYEFQYDDFSQNVAKFVSSSFIIGDKHWSQEKVVKNKLKTLN